MNPFNPDVQIYLTNHTHEISRENSKEKNCRHEWVDEPGGVSRDEIGIEVEGRMNDEEKYGRMEELLYGIDGIL
jgi:hypothetical protein